MRRILGTNLSPELQRQALACFVHRSTSPQSTARLGDAAKQQFADDADWLAHTLFWVTQKNTLAKRAACESHPTWPHNPELRTPESDADV